MKAPPQGPKRGGGPPPGGDAGLWGQAERKAGVVPQKLLTKLTLLVVVNLGLRMSPGGLVKGIPLIASSYMRTALVSVIDAKCPYCWAVQHDIELVALRTAKVEHGGKNPHEQEYAANCIAYDVETRRRQWLADN